MFDPVGGIRPVMTIGTPAQKCFHGWGSRGMSARFMLRCRRNGRLEPTALPAVDRFRQLSS